MVVLTQLDRFAKITANGINTVKERVVKVHVPNMGLIEVTPTGTSKSTLLKARKRL